MPEPLTAERLPPPSDQRPDAKGKARAEEPPVYSPAEAGPSRIGIEVTPPVDPAWGEYVPFPVAAQTEGWGSSSPVTLPTSISNWREPPATSGYSTSGSLSSALATRSAQAGESNPGWSGSTTGRALEPQRSAFRPPTQRSREWRRSRLLGQVEPGRWIEDRVGRNEDRYPRRPASPPRRRPSSPLRRRSPSPPPRRAPSPPRRRRSPSPVQALRRRFPSPDPLNPTQGHILMPTPSTPSTFRPANVQTRKWP